MNGRKWIAAVAAVLAVGTVGVAIGWAASGDTDQINACADKLGSLRLLSGSDACTAKETAVHWSITGPQGAQGPQGTPGAQGAQGPAGPQGPPGASSTGETVTVIGQAAITGTGFDPQAPINITSFHHDVKSPRDAASGLATGKRQYAPIIIRKQIDKTTPLLFKACVQNQTLPSITFSLNAGGTTPQATVKLTNAQCSEQEVSGAAETMSFTFQKITWTWLDGGITAEDDWQSQA